MTDAKYKLFDRNTRAIVYGLQVNAIQRMLNFDFTCEREKPSVAGIVNENRTGWHKVFWGSDETMLPVHPNLATAVKEHQDSDTLINFASFRSAYKVTREALEIDQIKTVVVIAEGVPERLSRELRQFALDKGKTIIGPATVGGVVPGAFKIANTGGTLDNIIKSKLYRPGSVGFVSKSGGMSNEAYNIISRNTDGLAEGIAIGGDSYPGSSLYEHVMRYEANPEIKMIVVLGEVGGMHEYSIVEGLNNGEITKPLVAWVTGTCARIMPASIQFGHAGAKADSNAETAQAKNLALAAAGAIVPESFDDLDKSIASTYQVLLEAGKVKELEDEAPPTVPVDYKDAHAAGEVRRKTGFTSTISDDRGEEVMYAGMPISKIVEGGMGIGDVIGLLWFKKKLPTFAKQYIELVLTLTADHGPAVSGAHNTIVCARAGRDLMSAVASGMLTIGPRFGGAVSGAAKMFKEAITQKLSPAEFITTKKQQGINIQGIGHRVKSLRNPDKRVELLKEFAQENFPATNHLDYALAVEALTTRKKDSLILNVDGAIGILFLDLMEAIGFTQEEQESLLEHGGLNGLFLLGRTIGMIGHFFDQCRLQEGLYRHPWDDILYHLPEEDQL